MYTIGKKPFCLICKDKSVDKSLSSKCRRCVPGVVELIVQHVSSELASCVARDDQRVSLICHVLSPICPGVVYLVAAEFGLGACYWPTGLRRFPW